MDENTGNTSEPTTDAPLTPTFQNKLAEKAERFRPKSFVESNIFRRFYRVPTLLSATVGVLFSALFAEVLYLFLPQDLVGFGAMLGFTIVMWIYFRPIISGMCLVMLVRRRVWEWGRYRFNSWKDLSVWMVITSPETLDKLVVDESDWEPDLIHGGIVADPSKLPFVA